jgi:competence protein ComQ
MKAEARLEMLRMVDDLFAEGPIRQYLHTFVEEKAGESAIWSNLAWHVHAMMGGNSPLIGRAMALTEMLMLALDIVDDVQDRDNAEKPWMKMPEAETLNAVLGMFAVIMAEWGKIGQPSLQVHFAKLLAQTIEGQQIDVGQTIRTEADYMDMVRKKSGSLTKLAFLMGYGLIGNLAAETVEQLDDLAECIGVMAQIANDMNDVQRYDVKNDLLLKKRTLPVLFMLEDSREEFPPIADYYEGRITAETFLQHKLACLAYIRDSGCLEYCRVIRQLYADEAGKLLSALPAETVWKDKLRELAFGTPA